MNSTEELAPGALRSSPGAIATGENIGAAGTSGAGLNLSHDVLVYVKDRLDFSRAERQEQVIARASPLRKHWPVDMPHASRKTVEVHTSPPLR
jgi:hypothetical protein